MAWGAVDISGFKGLKLDRSAQGVGPNEALDMLNVELDSPPSLRSRDGYAKLTQAAATNRYDRVAPVATGSTTSSSGPNSAGTGADDSGTGTIAWSNPGNITSSNDSYATAAVDLATSHYLKATNFGFSVPGTATITGILVEIERSRTAGSPHDARVRLINASGTIQTTDKADTATTWPATDAYASYGGAFDLWGGTWTPTDVNDADFGVAVSVTGNNSAAARVDHVRITVYYTAANTAFVLASSAGGVIDAINSDGSVATTVTTASDQAADYANFGSPSTSKTYVAVGSGSVLRTYSGGSFSTVSGSPKCRYLAVQSPDNRLFCANISTLPTGSGASSASTSLIHISNAGDPETFSANDFIYVFPGDGEDIQGMKAWREFVFVWKSTKFVVFYGNSDDADGNPVFNYRPVVTGVGLAAPLAVAPSPYGVFFMDRRGIYLTTGADPELVSRDIDPLFIGGLTSFWPLGQINSTALSSASMTWHNHRLYVGVALGSSTSNSHTLVYDPETKDWMIWDIPMGAMCSVGSNPATLVFTYASGTKDLGQYRPNAYTTDAGTAISWHYRSGFYTLGNSPSQRVSVGRSELVGTGSPTFSVSTDFGTVPASGGGAQANVTLGTSPSTSKGWHQGEQYGSLFSWQVEGSGAARVDSISHLVGQPTAPGE